MPSSLRVNTDQLNGQDYVWVVDQQQTLQKRSVEILYKGRKQSWVNIEVLSGDQLLISSLASKSVGMLVRSDNEEPNSAVASEESL